MLHSTLLALRDNGLIYKEITQWLRQKSFGALFIGLLGACELIAVLFTAITIDDNEVSAGAISFGLLSGLLGIYCLILAFSGHVTTSREFNDKTFELYALAGMSLEKMVLGKLLSFMTLFAFGVCCIIPFQFFAYLLGGIDFYAIVGSLLVALVMAPPIFLTALLIAAYQKNRASRILSRLAVAFVFFLIGPFGLISLFAMRFGGGAAPDLSVTAFLKALLEPQAEAWGGLAVGILFYYQLNALLFYLTAHAMRPSTDSREHIVKGYATSLLACVMLLFMWTTMRATWVRFQGHEFIYILTYVALCAMGVASFYGPLAVPVIIRRQREALAAQRSLRAYAQRFLFFWFEPGPAGLLRSYFLILILTALFSAHLIYWPKVSMPNPSERNSVLTWLSLPCAMPFFIAFPACLFYTSKKLSKTRAIGGMVVMSWVVTGVFCIVLSSVALARHRTLDSQGQYLLLWLSAAVSPISSVSAESWAKQMQLTIDFFPARFVMGAMGLIMMVRILQGRRKAERDASLPLAIPTPPANIPAPPLQAMPPPVPPPIPPQE